MEVEAISSYNVQMACVPAPAAKPADTGQAKSAPEKPRTEIPSPQPLTVMDKIERDDRNGIESALDKAVKEANRKLAGVRSEVHISIHKKTGLVSVKVVNSENQQVIREIPPEKTLDAIAKMWEMTGILLDEKR